MRQFVSAMCGLWFACAGTGWAQTAASEPVVVVELYTSQGCSSCPPADAFLQHLARNPSVIALALHVDYWDYIGWADSFADPRFTARQKAYAKAAGSRTIYTPQMIVEGQDRVEGHQPELVEDLIRSHLAKAHQVTLSLSRNGTQLLITAVANPPLSDEVRVQLVRYRPEQSVTIGHGENEGQTLTYSNIVTSWQVVGEWSGAAPLSMQTEAAGDDPVVVILQQDGPADILAAARLD